MKATLKDLAILAGINLLIAFLIWMPYLLHLTSFYGLNFSQGFPIIYRNFDGLEYVVIAKSFYNPAIISHLPQPLPATYFPSHFPGFPILIALFAPLLGFLKSMLFVSILFTILSSFAFYFLVKDFKLTSRPLWLSVVFLVLPARWLIVHTIGSPEPVFIFFTILAIYYFQKYLTSSRSLFLWLTAAFAGFAQLTRPPGILLFAALMLYPLYKNLKGGKINQAIKDLLSYYPLLLVPLTLLAIFVIFKIQLGDFFAYFHSGDNIHLTFPPFQVFNKNQFWVGDIWLEDIVYIFILGFLGGFLLLKNSLISEGLFVLIYLFASTLVAHRDIARYTLPIAPFILIAFEKILVSKEFKIVLAIVALGIYLYAQNFIINNVAPIPNLSVFN
ncbi:MAG: glycosyltransferase family 39 protein [Patescibacteria group bacterium]|nr:glycosyltransferase family 39 protein [Patescibacteria group bacterium]